MQTQNYKRINFNEPVEKYLIFEVTPSKKLLNTIRELKDVFPKQKEWTDLENNKDQKQLEILDKFRKKGKLYKRICQNWLSNNLNLVQAFNQHFENIDKEISTDEVLKFFKKLKSDFTLDNKDLILFVHIYI